ncbi:DUF932 domain-containing protein [Solitalea lacus]|uniref:DUF932 domain-containing protein n=1 Tax=Solitalea lacus TaxID=2911172 RepID=UPI001EDB05F4|nr:DUF932 domain-containing protein [Solitalea lacus]UKJ06233.1 DUF945 domain-containing protein [Solitalea lacus]
MAHNINFNESTNQHSFFSVGQKAWHGLGTIVLDYLTSSEALQFAGLDYKVIKSPLFTRPKSNNESDIYVPEYYATLRTDNNAVLGVVGKDYQIVQNTDAFSFFDSIVDGDGIMYETAGALGKGERIFITAKLPDYIKVGKDDLIEKYLFLTTSHDGSGSITAAFTPIRICCQNTLNAALKNISNSVKIRHTSGAKERLELAHKVLGISNKLSIELETIFNHWSTIHISDKEMKELIKLALVPNNEVLANLQKGNSEELSTCFKNRCDHAFEYAMSSPAQLTTTTKGTVFGAYNAVTGYFQNVRTYANQEAKVKSLLLGGTGQLRAKAAFKLCNDFAKHGRVVLSLN